MLPADTPHICMSYGHSCIVLQTALQPVPLGRLIGLIGPPMHYTAKADTSISVPDKLYPYITMLAKPLPAMAMPMAEYP